MTPHVRTAQLSAGHRGPGHALMSFPTRFLPAVSHLTYPTPDNTGFHAEVQHALTIRRADAPSPGLTHTTWMPLKHLFPQANVPVVELTLPFLRDRQLFQLGQRLAPLREHQVLIMASGSLTHNLASIDIDGSPPTPSWATEFDHWCADTLRKAEVDQLIDWRHKAPAARLNHPDDGAHFAVLLVALGAASRSTPTVAFPIQGFEASSQSKRSVQFS